MKIFIAIVMFTALVGFLGNSYIGFFKTEEDMVEDFNEVGLLTAIKTTKSQAKVNAFVQVGLFIFALLLLIL